MTNVAFDAVGPSSSGQTGTTSTISWTHTAVASGVALIVGLGYGHATGTDGTLAVTCDGTAMTLLAKIDNDNQTGASSGGLTALYGIANRASGAHAIAVTITGGPGSNTLEAGSASYSGADTSSPFGTAVTAFGNTAAPAVTVTGTAASSMVAGVASLGTGNLTNPATSRWTANFSNSNTAGNAGQSDKAGGGSLTFTWSGSGGADFWGAIGVEIKAAAAAAAGPTPYLSQNSGMF